MGLHFFNPNTRPSIVKVQEQSVLRCCSYLLLKMSRTCVQFTAAGNRNNNDGALNNVGSNGNYWSSTVSGINARNLNFNSSNADTNDNNRANGISVRCLKDNCVVYRAATLYSYLSLRIWTFAIILLCGCQFSKAQTITGHFPAYANEEIILTGYSGFNTYIISKTKADAQGRFAMDCSPTDRGMAYLQDADQKAYFVVLSDQDISIKGGSFPDPQSVECTVGEEQQFFMHYASEQPRREQALSAWGYLEGMYRTDSFFNNADEARKRPAYIVEQVFGES